MRYISKANMFKLSNSLCFQDSTYNPFPGKDLPGISPYTDDSTRSQGWGGGVFIVSIYPSSIARCQHIKVNGTQCGSPSLAAFLTNLAKPEGMRNP
jgi:hypothetical protein